MEHTDSAAATLPNGNGNGQSTPTVTAPPARSARAPKGLAMRALVTIADLRITVALFVLSLLLVFWGTLAQQDRGTWTAVSEFFRSFFVMVPLDVVFLKPIIRFQGHFDGAIPYPGGFTLGSLLLVNLLAAHAVSFKVSWKRSGILMIHTGIVVMMLSELVTYGFAREGQMVITEGDATNYVVRVDHPELAIVDSSDLKKDRVTVIPRGILMRGGTIQNAELPFDVEVTDYMVNSDLHEAKPGQANPATKGTGLHAVAVRRPENSGVDTDQKADQASIYATLKHKGTGALLGTYLFSTGLDPQRIEVDGKSYEVSLRLERVYKPYTFRLDKLNVEFYPRTEIPKDYSSFIHLTDSSQNENRDVRIYMNHPLHYAGETFYQSQVSTIQNKPATVLQVVRNPGWLMPYISCFLVATGMLIHFGINLSRFVERRAAK
jgi:hypothetical protein